MKFGRRRRPDFQGAAGGQTAPWRGADPSVRAQVRRVERAMIPEYITAVDTLVKQPR